jgi:hypothetical protein
LRGIASVVNTKLTFFSEIAIKYFAIVVFYFQQ